MFVHSCWAQYLTISMSWTSQFLQRDSVAGKQQQIYYSPVDRSEGM